MTHVIEDCVDEISLEGLDGITIPTLWLRLQNRQPTFQLPLDDDVKSYLWNCICALEELNFYVLPKARDDVVIWDRFKEDPGENDINFDVYEEKFVDIYPVNIIEEKGIKGSCATYKTRTQVTSKIRGKDGPLMSLAEAYVEWGRKLVIVASQERREQALCKGIVLKTPLDSKQYAILERTGRGRFNGEVSHGTKNLLAVVKESRSLFYVRKALQTHQLITVQSFGIRNSKGKMVSSKCIHLFRFGRERKTTAQVRLEVLTRNLDAKPEKRGLLSELREEMGVEVRNFKKLYDFGKKYIESKLIPYIELFPNAKSKEYMYKGGQSERYVRVLKLIKIYNANMEDKEEEGDGEDDDEEEGIRNDELRKPRQLELSIIQQSYEILRKDFKGGISEKQMSRVLNIGKLEGRGLCRDLDRLKLTVMMMKDVGRCRVKVYICDDLARKSALHGQIQKEKSKMLLNLGADANDAILRNLSDKGLHKAKKNPALAKVGDAKPKPNSGSPVTYRILRRTNVILKHVQENRLIDNMLWLRKKVDEDAAQETEKFTPFDKKGLSRLLNVLDDEKQIRIIRKTISVGEKTKDLTFICEPNISDDDPLVFAAIDSAKMRMVALSKSSAQRIELSKVQEVDQETPDLNLLRSQMKKAEMIHDSQAGTRYGFQSRMNRCKLGHQLLFYQVYDYCTNPEAGSGTNQQSYMNVESQVAVTEESDNTEDIYDVDRLKVYVDDLTFRRFIPPLRTYPGYENGWCLLGDIVLHMPVYVFCQIIRVNFKIPALVDFLKHPIRRLLPVSTLPPFIRQQLLYDRKFLHNFFDLCMSLAEMGLLSIGKKNYREKEQVFLYVHKYATLLDTTNLDISPAEWPVKHFKLESFHDVNHYWFTLNYICMSTPDDITNYSVGVTRFSNPQRAERFKKAHIEYTPETVVDDGHLPGDNLGAAGLDSSNYCHLRKNWVKEKNAAGEMPGTPLIRVNKPKKRSLTGDGKSAPSKKAKTSAKSVGKRAPQDTSQDADVAATATEETAVPSTSDGTAAAKKSRLDFRVDTVPGALTEAEIQRRERVAEIRKEKLGKVVKKTRKVKPKGVVKERRKTVLDEVDKAALQRMKKMRVKWTVAEDSCLLLFQVASKILAGTDRRGTILSSTLVRDFMHESFEDSLDKTSKACLRRLHYLMKNPVTVANVNMYLAEALTDMELMRGVKPRRNFKVINAEETNRQLIELVKRLRQKFKDQGVRRRIELPDTLEQVNSNYYISQVMESMQFEEPESVEDIEKGVLNNLIHAALLLSEKSNYTAILYNVLETYPEKALVDVLARMKRNCMITKVKSSKDVTRDSSLPNGNLGIYQLAQRYSYKWISKFPRSLFDESYLWMQKILKGDQFGPDGTGVSYLGESGCVSALVSLIAQKRVTFEIVLPENVLISSPSEISLRKKSKEKERFLTEKTESDEEEEALIDDLTEKTRNPPLCSRRCVSELRLQAEMTARKSMIACPTSDYVMVRCAIHMKPLFQETAQYLPKHPKNQYEADQILHQTNNNRTFLHPKSGRWIVNQKKSSQPVKLDDEEISPIWQLLGRDRFCLTKKQINVCYQIFEDVSESEELGITYMKLWMTHGHIASFEKCLSALVEIKLRPGQLPQQFMTCEAETDSHR